MKIVFVFAREFGEVTSGLMPPVKKSPAVRKHFYYGTLFMAGLTAFFAQLLTDLLFDHHLAAGKFGQFFLDLLQSSSVAVFIFVGIRTIWKVEAGDCSNTRERACLAIASVVESDYEIMGIVLDEISDVAEIKNWSYDELSESKRLSRVSKSDFEQVRDALVILKSKQRILDLKLSVPPQIEPN